MKPKLQRWVVAFLFAAALCSALPAAAEVILQFFNNSWNEITEKIPELAEAGYGSLWLPPPQKGSGGLSVGYDLWDPFDLGGKDQRGSIKTRYGTEAELLRLIETAHRFGMRVYFDNIMNHRAFDVPGWDENTPIDIYPGMLPEDFHLRVTEEGYYRKWDNTVNWGSTWEVQYRNLSDLIDIAHETPNGNFGYTEGSSHPKISFVRHPDNPEYYDFHPTLGHVGFGSTNITAELIATNQDYYKEDVGGYLCRNVRWLIDYTKVDGLRLDAVKHVPSWFFGEQYDPNKDTNFAGYCGQAQWQFDQTRGFTDNNNNRDSVFDTELSFGRNDAMMFGEHMGEPPGYDEYFAAGMRLVDAKIHQTLNDVLGNPWRSLDGLQYPDYTAGYQFGQYQGVPYAKSHDDNVAYREELHYAINLTRAGLPNIYTDGNRQAETLGQSGGAFPRHANTAYLGQWGDGRIPNLVCIHDHFARSWQYPKWGDGDVVAYERVDKRENESMEDYDGVVLLTAVCDNYSEGCYREIPTSFPEGAYLWQYSTGGGNFYTTVSDGKIKVIVPPGGYFCFSWRSPEESDLWSGFDGDPVTIYENGEQAGWVSCERRDGPDGDPAFNPYGVSDPNAADFSYTFYVPRVTSATNLRFVARADGSTEDVLMKLDGGMNLNDQNHTSGDPRDYPPGNTGSFDVFLGYEKAHHVHMQYREKFAARDTTSNNVIGSAGAETYTCTIGSSGFTVNAGETGRDSDVDTAEWMYHDPAAQNAPTGDTGTVYYQFDPPPASAGGSPITVRVKSGYQFDINRMWFYYRTDTNGWPEGAGGEGWEQTQVAEMNWYYGTNDGQVMDWWQCQIGPFTNGTPLRYKVGGANCSTGSAGYPTINVYPNDTFSIDNKKSMLGIWEATNINLQTMVYRPHNDWGVTSTGLVDGFHVLRARAFLQRPGQASIYNTFVQTFYLDTETPQGEVVYPAEYDTLGDSEYGVVVRTDPSVQGVWFNISDSLSANDDGETGSAYGNGTNADGVAWVEAYKVTPSLSIESEYPDEWRFNYRNVPASGVATVSVRLVEISSSTNFSFSDSDGHYTTLLRHVNTAGPTQDVYVAWPPNDGDMIWSGYDLKVYFSKTLASGVDEATLRNRFLISINDSAQAKTNYWFQWDADAEHHALAYTLPDFYNGDSNFLHSVEVLHTNAGGAGVTLRATRLVRFRSTTTGPQVQIIDPPEVDGDGQPYRIVLPDVASPSSTQRQYTIRVETGLEALDCWIRFTNSVGYVVPFASTTNPLTGYVSVSAASTAVTGHPTNLSGTVAVTYSNTTVTGTGTAFSNELAAGNFIRVSTNVLVVTQVVSQTSLQISTPYPGANASGQTAYVLPAFEYEVSPSSRLLINTNYVTVTQILSSSNLTLSTGYPGPTASGLKAYRVDGQPTVSGSKKYWSFLWTNMTAGNFTLVAEIDTNGTPSTVEASATRNTTVIFREMVNSDTNDVDDDDDGLYDLYEISPTNLPTTNPETWVNGDVHIWQIYGRTDPLMPDTDGDGLPDGLELGWRGPLSGTATNTDTDGDGWPNFRQDVDPPFYNTVPDNGNTYGLPNYTFYGSRTELIHGTMTDPSNADSDYDGLPDGVEDGNRNGWVDGDGLPLNNTGGNPWDERTTLGDWPDGVWDSAWTETDPDNNDTDQDLGTDGYGEDTNFNGRIDGDTNSNRIWEAGELWTETDPLNPDTDGDNLPDGWEVRYSLDPFDCGIVGYTNLRTGLLVSNTTHGASGDPDADTISNLSEYLGGTNPRVADTNETPPESSIDIGRGDPIGELSGSGTNYAEFLDWTIEDCLVLDEYEGGGNNNQGGDLYYGWDGWDTSRDIIAFYARDGGDPTNGGDGKFYFRVDFYDLQANAEEGNLDLYVVIDTGNPAVGEMNLPDEVDTITSNRYEAVVAVYQSGVGTVYVDLNNLDNSTTWGDSPFDHGVVGRTQSDADGFIDAYFNSELDSVEFAISRQALKDASWSGVGASNFNYQVFTTKDGTCNSCNGGNPGAGDIGGRSDVRDAIWNDFIAEDYWMSQASLDSILKYWIPGTTRAGQAKVAVVLHGNQAIQPGSYVQDLINTGSGAGYYRPLAAHELYGQPLNLHITPTLASAIEWAKVDTNKSPDWRDGPAFNDWLAGLYATNVVYLLGSTFSDHVLPYFAKEFNADNVGLANQFLNEIYGFTPNANTPFWTPERVLDADVFDKILDLGFSYTLIDQMTHLWFWLDRNTALADSGYKINQINGVKCFVMHDLSTGYRFSNTDNGLPTALRSLFNRKARSGTQDQVTTMFSSWEDFTDNDDANAYDLNVRWLANHPWIRMVAFEQVAAGQIDITGDGAGDSWYVENRGNVATNKLAHDWLHHATEENYDNWYVGSAYEEGLEGKFFDIRSGVAMPTRYGMFYSAGILTDTWDAVAGMADTNLARLARAALHASVFQTAFHNQTNANGTARYSTGEYIYEDTTYMQLAQFAKDAQAQTRTAAIYARVDTWADQAYSGWYDGLSVATNEDVDLDGEDEYLLYNDRVFGLLERIGGRLIGVWTRDIRGSDAFQAAGNQVGYAASETEAEGEWNVQTNGQVVAHRTSALKDWWAVTNALNHSQGMSTYINDLYAVVYWTNGWRLTSSDACIQKTVTLSPGSWQVLAQYQLSSPVVVLYTRHGLSPNLSDLLLHGQVTLGSEDHAGGVMTLANTAYVATVTTFIGYGDDGHSTAFNTGARDDNPGEGVTNFTIGMRNQAQTHQVELVGTNSFAFSLGFRAEPSDWDGDGMPNEWEDQQGLDPADPGDGQDHADTDQVPNRDEYVANTDPNSGADYFHVTDLEGATGVVVRFDAKARREYYIWYANDSILDPAWSNANMTPITVPADMTYEWLDDGSETDPDPATLGTRFYKIEVTLPQ